MGKAETDLNHQETEKESSHFNIHSKKAAEDSRTPRRYRDGLHDSPSARSWSAAVLCRFRCLSLMPGHKSGEVPRGAKRANEKLCGFWIVEDLSLLDIPFYFAADEHRNETEMAGNGGVMGGLDGSDGRLSALDAIEKVLLVIGGFVEFDFAQIVGEVFVITPLFVRRFESAAVHVNPTFGSNPFGAAANIGMAARDGHGD